jgi:predicted site-specific integrase-resolvase
MSHDYIDTRQAAEYVGDGVSPRTIVLWMKAGKLRYVRNPSVRGRYRTTTEWIDDALKAAAGSDLPLENVAA